MELALLNNAKRISKRSLKTKDPVRIGLALEPPPPDDAPRSEPLLTKTGLAEALKKSYSTIHRYNKRYPSFPRHPVGKDDRFYLSEVLEWFARRRKNGHKTFASGKS